jgi:hypothetical protein
MNEWQWMNAFACGSFSVSRRLACKTWEKDHCKMSVSASIHDVMRQIIFTFLRKTAISASRRHEKIAISAKSENF